MAKPNYAFAKRQRDIAKKQKKDDKKKLKAEVKESAETELAPESPEITTDESET